MKKRIMSLFFVLIFLISLTGCEKKEKSVLNRNVIISEKFDSKIESCENWQDLNFEKYGFSVSLPDELMKKENVKNNESIYCIENDIYLFNVMEKDFEQDTFNYLIENYLDDSGMYDNGEYLFEKDYCGNYKQMMPNEKIIAAAGAMYSEEENYFGYKILKLDSEKKSTIEITFKQNINEAYDKYYYITNQESNTFIQSFSLLDYKDENLIEYIQEVNELHDEIVKERALFCNNIKNIDEMIEQDMILTFTEYAGYLESIGYYEDRAIQGAFDAGLNPDNKITSN